MRGVGAFSLFVLLLVCQAAYTRPVAELNAELIEAVQEGDTEAVASLLMTRADVETTDDLGLPALIVATVKGHVGIVELLLDAGADPDTTYNYKTPLMFLVSDLVLRGSVIVEMAQLLIEAGADVDVRDLGGDTVLMYAVTGGDHPEVVRLLLEAGAEVNAKNNKGYTALEYACYMAGDSTVDLVKVLLDAGADVDAKDNEGRTPLGLASVRSQYGETAVEDLLKEYGATDYGSGAAF